MVHFGSLSGLLRPVHLGHLRRSNEFPSLQFMLKWFDSLHFAHSNESPFSLVQVETLWFALIQPTLFYTLHFHLVSFRDGLTHFDSIPCSRPFGRRHKQFLEFSVSVIA